MTDLDNDPLAAVFDEFRSEVAPFVHPIGAAGIREGARTRKQRRTVAIGALAAVVIAVPVAAGTIFAGHPRGVAALPSPVGPSVYSGPTRSAPTTAPAGGISVAELNRSRLDIPAWAPDATAKDCLTGPVPFTNGQSAGGNLRVDNVAYADIDHDGRYETVARIYCIKGPTEVTWQVVAFARDGAGGVRTVGQVTDQTGSVAAICTVKAGSGGSVKVLVLDFAIGDGCVEPNSGGSYVQQQWRTFTWTGSAFKQTGGPTSFPPNPNVSDLALSSTDLIMKRQADGHYRGTLTQTVHNLGAASIPYSIEFAVTTGLRIVTPATGCKVVPALTFGRDTEYLCPGGTLAGGSTRTLKITFDATHRVDFDGVPNTSLELPANFADQNDQNDQLNFAIKFQD